MLISFTVKLVSKIMSLSRMCCVVYPSVLLSMLLLVEAKCLVGSSCHHDVSAKVEGMYLRGNSYSQGR
jgi:hypothetical protein